MQMQQMPVAQSQYYPEVLDVKEFPDHYVYTIKDEASTGKKWELVSVHSSYRDWDKLLMVNGEKAAAFLGGAVATSF